MCIPISPLCAQLFPELPRGKENRLISNSNWAESGAENSGSGLKTELLLLNNNKSRVEGGWGEEGSCCEAKKDEQNLERDALAQSDDM